MVKKVGLLILVLFLLVAVGVTFFVVKQQQELRQKAAPATTMSISPSQKTVKPDDTFTIDVNIDTGENSIVAASVYLTYDPVKLQAQSIVNSAQFPNILSSGNTSQTGKVSIAVGTASISQPFKGIGAVATVTFKALQASDTPVQIKFGPEAFAGSIGEGSTNALIGTTPANITISADGTTQPTATPAPTIAGQPTATPAPTIAGQPTATPTRVIGQPTATPTITPTPVPGQLSMSSPTSGSTTSTDPPTLSGNAPAGSAITITFYPGSVAGAVTADSSGHWTFTPSAKVGIGTYTVTITSTNNVSGAVQTVTSTVIISSATTSTPTLTPTPTTSGSTTTTTTTLTATPTQAIPVTGSMDMTYIVSAVAIIFLAIGIVLPFTIR